VSWHLHGGPIQTGGWSSLAIATNCMPVLTAHWRAGIDPNICSRARICNLVGLGSASRIVAGFAVVTNLRGYGAPEHGLPSRGKLVRDPLAGEGIIIERRYTHLDDNAGEAALPFCWPG
jgi:hypothetical protein